MSAQPEALRLADALDYGVYDAQMARVMDKAAAELRRLHQFAEDQIGRATAAEAALQMTKSTHALKIAAVEAQRDALLEALSAIVHAAKVHACHHALSVDGQQFYDIARAAIKDFAEMRGLSLDDAKVQDWNAAPPQQVTPSMAEITRLRAERDALGRLREVRNLLTDTTDAYRKKVVMNAWAEQKLARHGIPMPEGDPK